MYQVSNECKQILNSNVVITTARVTFSDPQLVIDGENLSSIKIKDYCYNEGRIIGTNIARDVEMVIKNGNYDLQDKEFFLEVGVRLSDNTYEYIPFGNFIIDSVQDMKSNKQYKITAMDYMIKFNKPFVEFEDSLYPMTIREFLVKFAEQYEVALGDDENLPNEDLILPERPFLSGVNGRTVLKYLAEVFGRFAKFDRAGRLRFILQTQTNETISRNNMNSKLEIDNEYGEVNVVSILLSDDITGENATLRDEESIALYGENIIKIVGNELLSTAELRESAVTPLFNALKGFKYVPTSFNYMGRIYLDCGDRIQVQDMETDNYYGSIVLNNYFEIPKLRASKMENLALTKTSVEMQYVPEEEQKRRKTEFRVDKVEGEIELINEEQNEQNTRLSSLSTDVNSIKGSISLIGGNNKQKNSIGAYGTEDYEQSQEGHILAYEDETLKTVTDNGFGRIIYLTDEKWFKFKSDSLVIGETYTLSFKYSNDEDNHCVIDFINNNTTNLVDTLEEKTLEKVEYTFTANTEFVELYVSTGEVGRVGITDYYLQTGDIATKWQPASGEALSTTLAIYYDGIEVTSGSSEIITNISNLGFTVKNTNGKILITFNKDRCIMNDAEINGTLHQGTWLRYTQTINGYNHLLEVEI